MFTKLIIQEAEEINHDDLLSGRLNYVAREVPMTLTNMKQNSKDISFILQGRYISLSHREEGKKYERSTSTLLLRGRKKKVSQQETADLWVLLQTFKKTADTLFKQLQISQLHQFKYFPHFRSYLSALVN